MLNSRAVLLLSGALIGLTRPRLAVDAKIDFEPLLADITADNLAGRAGKLSVGILAAVQPHLATDSTLDIEDIVQTISTVAAMDIAGDVAADAAAPPPPGGKAPAAADADPDDDDGAMDAEAKAAKAKAAKEKAEADKPAGMDNATVATMISDAVANERTRAAAIDQAREDVRPFIGAVTGAVDSAAAVYKLALDAAKIDLTGRAEGSYRDMVAMLPKPGTTPGAATVQHALDSASVGGFRERFPNASNLQRA